MSTFYSRRQIVEILEIEESFLVELEQEEIVVCDSPEDHPGEYSERMLERARVADNLIHELDVNLAGAAVIVRLREEVATLRHALERLAADLRQRS